MEESRRKFFKKTILAGSSLVMMNSSSAACIITPAQTEGPFYPIEDQLDTDTDLVFKKGASKKARGKVVYVKGRVLDQQCKPVERALVEIWQACDTGKYNHPNDPNSAPLDPNFQYWGKAITNKKGEYIFRTIIPGAYPATSTWKRPPHIHFKVSIRGYEELVTQMYFKGESLNQGDKILQSLSELEKKNVIVDFKKVKNRLIGNFDITINKIF